MLYGVKTVCDVVAQSHIGLDKNIPSQRTFRLIRGTISMMQSVMVLRIRLFPLYRQVSGLVFEVRFVPGSPKRSLVSRSSSRV